MKRLIKYLLNRLLTRQHYSATEALDLIALLRGTAYERITVSDEKQRQLVEPVTDEQGRPLMLTYLGKERQMYKYKNENDGMIGRLFWIRIFDLEKERGATKAQTNAYLDKTLQMLNEGKPAEAGNAVLMLKDLVNNCSPIDVLYNQAAILLFDDEEDLSTYDADRNAAKIKAMKGYPDPGFFFALLLTPARTSGKVSVADIRALLKRDMLKNRAYERVLSEMGELLNGKDL
jgi:hypothetical protein